MIISATTKVNPNMVVIMVLLLIMVLFRAFKIPCECWCYVVLNSCVCFCLKAAEDQTQADSVPHTVVSAPHEINIQVFSSGTDQVTRLNDKTEDLHKQGISDSTRNPDASSGAGPHMSNLTSMDDSGSAPNNNVLPTVSQCLIESEKEKEMHVDEKGTESVYKNQGEKGDVIAENQPCPTLNVSAGIFDIKTPAVEERIETCNF